VKRAESSVDAGYTRVSLAPTDTDLHPACWHRDRDRRSLQVSWMYLPHPA